MSAYRSRILQQAVRISKELRRTYVSRCCCCGGCLEEKKMSGAGTPTRLLVLERSMHLYVRAYQTDKFATTACLKKRLCGCTGIIRRRPDSTQNLQNSKIILLLVSGGRLPPKNIQNWKLELFWVKIFVVLYPAISTEKTQTNNHYS